MATYTDLHIPRPTTIASWTPEFHNKVYYDRPTLSYLFPNQFCQRCIPLLRSNKIPRRARCNGFRSVPIPNILRQLNPLEAQLVSPYIPFFNIVRDTRVTQFKMHGAIIAIPLDPQRTFISQLPRVQTTSHLFEIQIIKESTTQRDRKPFIRGSVFLPKLLEALQLLLQSTLLSTFFTAYLDTTNWFVF